MPADTPAQEAPMTLIPTMQLRWLVRAFPLPATPECDEMRFVLQQRFDGPRGAEWIDVPTVGEDE